MNKKLNTESGFTLLELLIALAMVAVLVTFCLMAVRLATASRESGNQKADIHQRLRILHEQLNSTLRSAHLIFVPNESESLLPDENEEESSNSKVLAFEGKAESLRFVTFSEKLMKSEDLHSMHEVHFYLQKNEDTGSLEILLNERNFSPKGFFKQDSPGREIGQTLRIAQDVAYLKFRYYYETLEKGTSSAPGAEKSVKVSSEWADKIITEPFDFKSNINGSKEIGKPEDSVRIPKAIEVSIGLWEPGDSEAGLEPEMVEVPPTLIPIQAGMVFERFEEEEDSSVPKE
jgi:prepilin-type N-terminal cleavage/methylation domain-containing protein